jgi:hypothetical protein
MDAEKILKMKSKSKCKNTQFLGRLIVIDLLPFKNRRILPLILEKTPA